MPKVISCSRRTDVPAFYSTWLIERLRVGYCHVINPFGGQVYRVALKPEDCIAIVFWTRNPGPLLASLEELDARGYRYYFHYTILGYPSPIESHNPSIETSVRLFKWLANRLSPMFVRWRYDPIILSSVTPWDYHLEQFSNIARMLEGATYHCTFSFVDLYGKTTRNLDRLTRQTGIRFHNPSLGEQRKLVHELVAIADSYGMTLNSCCSDALAVGGVQRGRCIDPKLVQKLAPDLNLNLKAKPTRADCGCVESIDIGAYDSCLFGCTYCYATNSRKAAKKRHSAHRPSDTVLWRPRTLEGVDLEDIAVPLKG